MPKNQNRQNFSNRVRTSLAERVAYMCSNPYCRKLTIKPKTDDHKSVKYGKACHILSAANGPRRDQMRDPDYISSFDNGIWLCDTCAREVDDNLEIYSESLLQKWKREAEVYVATLVTQDTRLRQLRALTQSALTALRILSGLPTHLDHTFNSPLGQNINLTRMFMELELMLFENSFPNEARFIGYIINDLDLHICPFVHNESPGGYKNIFIWKKEAVRLMMVEIMQYSQDSYEMYLKRDERMFLLAEYDLQKNNSKISDLHFENTYVYKAKSNVRQ